MKANNKPYITFKLYFTIVFILINFLLMVWISVTKKLYEFEYVIPFALFAISVFYSFRIKIMEIEVSGEVLTIRNYHPFNAISLHPIIELPLNKLAAFTVVKSRSSHLLDIKIENPNRSRSISFVAHGMNPKKMEQIRDKVALMINSANGKNEFN